MEFFLLLFSSEGFVTRSQCGDWNGPMMWAYIISNAIIGLSYMAIPVALGVLWWKRRKDIPHPAILKLFILFVFLCGVTHFLDIVVFGWAGYRLFTVILVLTALVSAITACFLPFVVRALLKAPTIEQYKKLLEERDHLDKKAKDTYQALLDEFSRRGRQNERLRDECNDLKSQIEHLLHKQVTEQDITAMRSKLHAIRGAAQ